MSCRARCSTRCAARPGCSRRCGCTTRAARRAWRLPAARRDGRSSRASTISQQRRDWLKQARVDHQLVGGWTDVYGYELQGEEAADWARFYNEHMAKDAAALPSLSALATVPLQNGALAATSARRGAGCRLSRRDDRDAAEGHRRQSRRSRSRPVLGIGLVARRDDLRPSALHLRRRAAGRLRSGQRGRPPRRYDDRDREAAVFRTPDPVFRDDPGVGACRRRLALRHRPAEAQPRDPPGLRRSRGRVSAGSISTRCCSSRSPCAFCATWSGADKVVLGSDYPFGIGDLAPVGIVENTPLTKAERDAILGGNAARIFHIDCACGQGG